MMSDDYHIPEQYNVYEDEIRRFIDEIGKDFVYLREYIDKFHYFLKEAGKSDEEYEKLSSTGKLFFRDYGYSSYYPNVLNYSFIVFAFITFENQLRVMTKIIFDNFNPKDKFHLYLNSKYKGGNFDKYLAFYNDQFKIKHSRFRYWQQIEKFNKIRNCIVHVSGFLSDSKDKADLRATIKSRSYFGKEDKAKIRVIYPSKGNFFEEGEIAIDEFEERLVIGAFYCKRIIWYWECFISQMMHHSDMAIYANWDD